MLASLIHLINVYGSYKKCPSLFKSDLRKAKNGFIKNCKRSYIYSKKFFTKN